MAYERNNDTVFNIYILPVRLREMYERRVLYVEEIISDMRSLSGGRVAESFLKDVRTRHIAHAQETVLEIVEYARSSQLLNQRIRTRVYSDVVRDPELPTLG